MSDDGLARALAGDGRAKCSGRYSLGCSWAVRGLFVGGEPGPDVEDQAGIIKR